MQKTIKIIYSRSALHPSASKVPSTVVSYHGVCRAGLAFFLITGRVSVLLSCPQRLSDEFVDEDRPSDGRLYISWLHDPHAYCCVDLYVYLMPSSCVKYYFPFVAKCSKAQCAIKKRGVHSWISGAGRVRQQSK